MSEKLYAGKVLETSDGNEEKGPGLLDQLYFYFLPEVSSEKVLAKADRIAALEEFNNESMPGLLVRTIRALGYDAVIFTPGVEKKQQKQLTKHSTFSKIDKTKKEPENTRAKHHVSRLFFVT